MHIREREESMKTKTQFEIVVSTLVLVLLIGTLAYHNLEGWGYVDSFYFTGMTMTTVGYGDLHPTTDLSKIFTVFFAFAGVGVSLFALSLIAAQYFERREIFMEKQFIRDIRKSFDKKEIRRKRNKILSGAKDL